MSASFSFNAVEYTQQPKSPYTSWSIGRTPCMVISATEGVGANSGNPYYCIEIEGLAGENQGKRHKMYYVTEHPSPKVLGYAKRDLASLVIACGLGGFNHVAELGGKKFVVDVACYLSKKTGEMTQSFNRFEPFPEPAAGVNFDPHASTYGQVKSGAYRAKQPGIDTTAPIQDDPIPF